MIRLLHGEDLVIRWTRKMLRSLRWKLALLYFSSAVGIVVLLAAGSYLMLNRYFTQQVDLALQYKMAGQFTQYGLTLPPELVKAQKLWLDENQPARGVLAWNLVEIKSPEPAHSTPTGTPVSLPTPTNHPQTSINSDSSHGDDDESEQPDAGSVTGETGESEGTVERENESFDSRLSSIFVVPVSTQPGTFPNSQIIASPINENFDASNRALSLGYDLRTVQLSDGSHARLLTYRTLGDGIPATIQIGRLLDDQDSLLRQYLMGLLILGVFASCLITILSWFLSGRSIRPAQAAWDQQQLFISNASHELRAPVTLIRANADYAIRSNRSKVRLDTLKDVMGEVDYMNHLVDDLLLLSRLDTHRLILGRTGITTDSLLQEIVRQTEVIAKARGVRIVMLKSDCQIIVDPIRIRQVILSLIDNALRFTPSGGKIELGAIQNGKSVDLYVRDNGTGIAPEHMTNLFERFYQVPGTVITGERNNGLGLSIAKALVEAQGGKIRIDSQIGFGTTVWITMPAL